MNDRILFGILISVGIALVVGAMYAIPKQLDRDNRADEYAKANGCVCLGHARDMNSVFFLDCDGEIKLVRVK